MFRRHPVLASVLLFFLAVVAVLAYVLITFDLNRYRLQLQDLLSQTAGRPVTMGEAHLSLRHGLSFRFSDLRVGRDDDVAASLSAERLYLRLDWAPLLRGRIEISQALLDTPVLGLPLNRPAEEKAAPPKPPPDLSGLHVRSLTIRRGALRLFDAGQPGAPTRLRIEEIDGRLTDLFSGRPVQLRLQGSPAAAAGGGSLALSGRIGPEPSRWRESPFDLKLSGEHLAPGPLLADLFPADRSWDLTGTISLHCTLRGVPAGGLRLEGELLARDAFLAWPDRFRQPRPLPDLRFGADWTVGEKENRLAGLRIEAGADVLRGDVALTRREAGLWLQASLEGSEVGWDRVRRYLPDTPSAGWPARAGRQVRQARLRLSSLRFDGFLAEAGLPVQQAILEVKEGAIDLGEAGLLDGLAVTATWRPGRLLLENGLFSLKGGDFQVGGEIQNPLDPRPGLAFQVGGRVPAAALTPLLSKEGQKVAFTGSLDLKGRVEGTADHLLSDLRVDLKELGCRFGETELKPVGMAGDLFVTGLVSPETIEVSHAKLTLPFVDLRARGDWARGGGHPFHLVLDLSPVDMARARSYFPLFDRLETQGHLALQADLSGAGGRIRQRRGTVFLRGFGVRPTSVVGRLNEISGELRLDGDRAVFREVAVRVGRSPLQVSGTIGLESEFFFDLSLRGRSVHADDLIFPSPAGILQEIEGRLVIDRNGILFDRIRARLPQGTVATVDGRLTDYAAPRVDLRIVSPAADIDEVIGLWQTPPDHPPTHHGPARPETWLTIETRAEQGTLWNLRFQDATGRITYGGRTLSIGQLQFKAEGGECSGQVDVEGGREGPPLLRISGRLERVDAAALHHELLKRRGLVTGSLSGMFYLEGEAGGRFLPTSLGEFQVEIKDGVLRRWPFLAKVFSLLNVSQILTLKLPDMAREGMPFQQIGGTFTLRQGVLGTEDLFVESNAMNLSMVGEADLNRATIDLVMGLKPLRTVDKIITRIPIAGWILTGEEKALVTAHFKITGPADDPTVTPIPITSVSEKVLGIFKRVLGLPGKMVSDVEKILGEEKK